MGQCVKMVGSYGTVQRDDSSIYPECTQFYILGSEDTAGQVDFWQSVSTLLEPGQPGAWEFYAATLLVFVAAFGAKQVARLILNR